MKRILFVDDEARILDGLCRSLRNLRGEWEMVFAEGGAAALRECGARPFDVVISDARMSGMEGAELLGKVRDLYPDTVRVILSGQCSRNSVLKCVGVAHQFLSKPCEPATLRLAVQRVCRIRNVFSAGPTRKAVSCVQWLPSQSQVRQELVDRIESPTASIERVAGIVARDLGMSAKAVQLVTSGFFGTPQRVSNAAHAAKLLGLETLKAMSASASAFRSCAENGSEEDLHLLTSHSLAVAEAAGRIAETLTGDRTLIGDAYLAGLLHAVGRLALTGCNRCSPRALGEGRGEGQPRRSRDPSPPSTADDHPPPLSGQQPEVGRAGGPYRRGSVRDQEAPDPGGYLAALWGLPDPVVQAIAYHRAPGGCPDQPLAPLTAVHVAQALLERGGDAADEAAGPLDVDYLRASGCAQQLGGWREKCQVCRPAGGPQ